MKNSFLLLVLFVVPFLAEADNWELFPPNQVTYFHFTGENMDAISPFYVDAVETINDATYQYNLRNYMEELSGDCYENLAIPTITDGETIVRFPNEVIVLQNGWYGETVFEANPTILPKLIFNAQANLGDKWVIESENFQNFDQLEVSCIAVETEVFLELEDNVKTFHLQALQNGNPVSSSFNEIVFKISDKYGLISGIPLKELLQNEPTTQMQLAGFEDENGILQGRGAYTFLDFVPDFEVRDILKWELQNHCRGFTTYLTNSFFRDSITAVYKTDTSIQYNFERKTEEQRIHFTTEEELSVNFYSETDSIIYSTNKFDDLYYHLDLIYYGFSFFGQKKDANLYVIEIQSFDKDFSLSNSPQRTLTILHDGIVKDNCTINQILDIGSLSEYNTMVGFHNETNLCLGHYFHQLIGYRIGNEEGGDIDPIITNIESSTHFASQITLHPNPTQNRFLLQLQNPKLQLQNLQLKITDIHGRTLQQLPLLQSAIEIDLSDQPNGIYLVQISDGMNWWTEKVVKY